MSGVRLLAILSVVAVAGCLRGARSPASWRFAVEGGRSGALLPRACQPNQGVAAGASVALDVGTNDGKP